jgi:hypothetical protein
MEKAISGGIASSQLLAQPLNANTTAIANARFEMDCLSINCPFPANCGPFDHGTPEMVNNCLRICDIFVTNAPEWDADPTIGSINQLLTHCGYC